MHALIRPRTVVTLLLAVTLLITASGCSIPWQWRMFQKTPDHSGISGSGPRFADTSSPQLTLAWSVQLTSGSSSVHLTPPIVAYDENDHPYVVLGATGETGHLYAVDVTNENVACQWPPQGQTSTELSFVAGPGVDDQRIFVAANHKSPDAGEPPATLYGLDLVVEPGGGCDLVEIWHKDLDATVTASLTIPGRTVLVFTDNHTLYHFDGDGNQKWKADVGQSSLPATSAPTVFELDKKKYVLVGSGRKFRAYDLQGNFHAEHNLGAGPDLLFSAGTSTQEEVGIIAGTDLYFLKLNNLKPKQNLAAKKPEKWVVNAFDALEPQAPVVQVQGGPDGFFLYKGELIRKRRLNKTGFTQVIDLKDTPIFAPAHSLGILYIRTKTKLHTISLLNFAHQSVIDLPGSGTGSGSSFAFGEDKVFVPVGGQLNAFEAKVSP